MSNNQVEVTGEYVSLDDERYYRISNSHLMPDFFMSLVGAGDHWMFVSSSGALTAGRRNPDLALFPYAADDQISAARQHCGSLTQIRVNEELWAPLATSELLPGVHRNLYKTPLGNKLVFEEVSDTLQLSFRYRWTFSQRFGFVRTCCLTNHGASARKLELLDGLHNVLPFGVGSEFMMRFSNLANAYKKSELVDDSNVGLFYLSSIPTDRAEPSEGLRSTVVWQVGLDPSATLLSPDQIALFCEGGTLQTETDVRGKCGAYLLNQSLELAPNESICWHVVAELAQDHAGVVGLHEWLLKTPDPGASTEDDVHQSEQELLRILSSSDGLQCGENQRRANRHLSNTIFNVMRGGIPLENYLVDRDDFSRYLRNFNRDTAAKHQKLLEELPDKLAWTDLQERVAMCNDIDLSRLSMEYLPLAFGRRHGDPTRPWNRFSIELTADDGSTNLNYQGNWRDIFQNWEALAFSFPGFTTAMICRFVNATTADGYNPYRLTKDGFEWEEPTPDDPWANIGYWGDHQIIYLLKLLEWSSRVSPQQLDEFLNSPTFAHANIPYRIREFHAIRKNVRDTIEFDHESSAQITQRVEELGADGKLLQNADGHIHYVTLMEKLLTLSLAKLSNFIPDGGIWLNTQRPEWNDANNALVGNGLSMVTTCYLYRWFTFLEDWISSHSADEFVVSVEVVRFFESIDEVLQKHSTALESALSRSDRREVVAALSQAGSDFRSALYSDGLSGQTSNLSRKSCLAFLQRARHTLRTTIRNNRREDGLYHAYNLLDAPRDPDWRDGGLGVENLYEMLEGQVAVLSSGLLSASEVVELLDALRSSSLYRENQNSYLLYPDRQLPRFLDKNRIPPESVAANTLVTRLLEQGNSQVVSRDARGDVHFNGDFRNSADLEEALQKLDAAYDSDVANHGTALCQVFDEIFGHRQFTGRSGTFFAYEGLGSIYWHMVSKLGLAVSENLFAAIDNGESDDVIQSLRTHLDAVRAGIGAEKSPLDYGAFPSDPYSHTPENAGVKQPGMTGQVKEDVLVRFAELGAHVEDGRVRFRLDLFDRQELLREPAEFSYFDIHGTQQTIQIPQHGFTYTFCQVPVTYVNAQQDAIHLRRSDGETVVVEGTQLDEGSSRSLFLRTGEILEIVCHLKAL